MPTDVIVHHRHMPDGYMYEVQRVEGDAGWKARRAEGEPWIWARSIAFAVIRASVTAPEAIPDPQAFGDAAREWEREIKADERKTDA